MVLAPNMRQLAQRVAASFHLERMGAGMVRAYVAHRLQAVPAARARSSPGGPARWCSRRPKGVPRLINQLCDFAMLYAWSADARVVDHEIVESVLADGVFFGGQSLEEDAQAGSEGRTSAKETA